MNKRIAVVGTIVLVVCAILGTILFSSLIGNNTNSTANADSFEQQLKDMGFIVTRCDNLTELKESTMFSNGSTFYPVQQVSESTFMEYLNLSYSNSMASSQFHTLPTETNNYYYFFASDVVRFQNSFYFDMRKTQESGIPFNISLIIFEYSA